MTTILAPDLDATPKSPATARPIAPPVRVLHFINGEHYSGAERVQDLLAQRLPDFGYGVGFACAKPGRFPRERQARTAPLFDVAMRHKLDPRPVFELARLIRTEGYGLLHTHTPRTAILGSVAARLAGVPFVHHVHSPTTADSTRRWANRLNAWGERRAMRRAAAIIAVSRSLGRYAQSQGVAVGQVTVVPNGVSVRGPLPPRQPPRENWTLGMVALFRPRKGLEVLLDAVAVLRAEGKSIRLRAIGPFETAGYEAAIRRRVAELRLDDAIDWVGFTSRVDDELARCDLFALPSLFGEGLPMVVLEAMAAGLPIVATRVEGVPEAIRDGLDGVLAEPADAMSLAEAVRRIIRGDVDWNALRASAHARQASDYSDESMARGVAAVYDRVLERRR